MTCRLVLLDDQVLFTAALTALLNLESDITVVGQFSNGFEALLKIPELEPDIVITDIEMPGLNGFQFSKQLMEEHQSIKIIALSAFGRTGYLDQVIKLGLHGYLLKESTPEKLINGIRNVMAGIVQIDPELRRSNVFPCEALTAREIQILLLVRDGVENKKIAEAINLSPGTVRNTVSEILAKLNAKNRIEACRIAEKQGYL